MGCREKRHLTFTVSVEGSPTSQTGKFRERSEMIPRHSKCVLSRFQTDRTSGAAVMSHCISWRGSFVCASTAKIVVIRTGLTAEILIRNISHSLQTLTR
jgi:hypothetical protein